MPQFVNKKIPPIGLGTCFATGAEMFQAVQTAIRVGYRHLDLSPRYGNQKEIGQAIQESIKNGHIRSRNELILSSKLYHTCHRPELIEKQLNQILEELNTTYLDYFLIHAPWAFEPKDPTGQVISCEPAEDKFGAILEDISYVDCWENLLKIGQNKVRHFGVSNFSCKMIDQLYQKTGVYPAVNQIECHVLLQQDNLLDYCRAKNIQVIAYGPTGENKVVDDSLENSPHLRNHPVVAKIAAKYNTTNTMILLRYHYERGICTIPKSKTEKFIVENFQASLDKFNLDFEDFLALKNLNRDKRFFGFNWIGKVMPKNYPFKDEF